MTFLVPALLFALLLAAAMFACKQAIMHDVSARFLLAGIQKKGGR